MVPEVHEGSIFSFLTRVERTKGKTSSAKICGWSIFLVLGGESDIQVIFGNREFLAWSLINFFFNFFRVEE